MSYKGPSDPGLPDNVKRLPENRRAQWVSVFNSSFARCQRQGGSDCEASAFRQANGVALEADELTTKDVRDVEILRMGNWNGFDFTRERLDQIVEAHNATLGLLDPPVKLGHDDNQKLIQEDGFPAAGWVENVRRIGQKLMADFRRVPTKVADLIQAGALRKRSSEIRFDMEIGGRTWPIVLTGVALLGADLPAVDSLDDIATLYQSLNLDLDEDATAVVGDINLARWTRGAINDLPDSAFAGISPGGKKEGGKTVPRGLRHLPHHGEGGAIDKPHLRSALRRLQDVKGVSVALKRRMLSHLGSHARSEGVESEVKMELKAARRAIRMEDELRELLGLNDDGDVVTVVRDLVNLSQALKKSLALGEGETILGKVEQLTKVDSSKEKADDGRIAELEGQVTGLEKQVLVLQGESGQQRATKLVEDEIQVGRLLPRQRDVAVKLALRDEGEFKAFVESLPKGQVDLSERGTSATMMSESGVDLADLEPDVATVALAKETGLWSEEYRLDLIRQKAAEKGVTLPVDFGKQKKEDE